MEKLTRNYGPFLDTLRNKIHPHSLDYIISGFPLGYVIKANIPTPQKGVGTY